MTTISIDNSQGFDSTTISPNFWMLVAMVFRSLSIRNDSFVWFRLWLLTSDCKHVSCASTSFSIPVENILLNQKQKINMKESRIRGCSLLPQVTVNTCRVLLLLSLFALRPNMLVGLMHTFLCWLHLSGIRRQNRETNSDAAREHKMTVENEIQELRTKINNHLDKQSRWVSTIQIPQHGHSWSLQYKLNFSWCSLQCSLISNTYDGNFWYSAIGIVVCFLEDLTY
jgi:hypothetical protein